MLWEGFVEAARKASATCVRRAPIRGIQPELARDYLLSEISTYAVQRLKSADVRELVDAPARVYGLARVLYRRIIARETSTRREAPLAAAQEPYSEPQDTLGVEDELSERLSRLSPEDRELVNMYSRDCSLSEIAMEFGVSKEGARKRLASAFYRMEVGHPRR